MMEANDQQQPKQPGAKTRHDIEDVGLYNKVDNFILSKTMADPQHPGIDIIE
ncbi:MAG TPA: hypothetical protein VFO54_06570 [Chryseosolibacter sp.]|nr:hypothetical protein [Chryseosolibacter sp.]